MIGDKVKKWGDELGKVIAKDPMGMLGRPYPDAFISEAEEYIGDNYEDIK